MNVSGIRWISHLTSDFMNASTRMRCLQMDLLAATLDRSSLHVDLLSPMSSKLTFVSLSSSEGEPSTGVVLIVGVGFAPQPVPPQPPGVAGTTPMSSSMLSHMSHMSAASLTLPWSNMAQPRAKEASVVSLPRGKAWIAALKDSHAR